MPHTISGTAVPQNMSPMGMTQRLPMAQQQMRQPMPGHPGFDGSMSSQAGHITPGNYMQQGPSMMSGPQQPYGQTYQQLVFHLQINLFSKEFKDQICMDRVRLLECIKEASYLKPVYASLYRHSMGMFLRPLPKILPKECVTKIRIQALNILICKYKMTCLF